MILNYCNLCNYETISLKSNQHSLDIKSVYIKYPLNAVVVEMNAMVYRNQYIVEVIVYSVH